MERDHAPPPKQSDDEALQQKAPEPSTFGYCVSDSPPKPRDEPHPLIRRWLQPTASELAESQSLVDAFLADIKDGAKIDAEILSDPRSYSDFCDAVRRGAAHNYEVLADPAKRNETIGFIQHHLSGGLRAFPDDFKAFVSNLSESLGRFLASIGPAEKPHKAQAAGGHKTQFAGGH
jgi:hypothetical protein